MAGITLKTSRAALVATAGAATPAAVLAALGFGVQGPAAGSVAAAWHALIGATVESGSAFAVLQSMAMGGCGTAVAAIKAIGAAGAVYVARSRL